MLQCFINHFIALPLKFYHVNDDKYHGEGYIDDNSRRWGEKQG